MSASTESSDDSGRWRLLPYHVGATAAHFALSDALVRCGPKPTVWWHSTARPTLILGPTQSRLDLTAARRAGVDVVRRSAGGAAVYAGPGVLGQDVFLPAGHSLAPADVVEGYRWLGESWLRALTSLGAEGHLVSVDEARGQPPPDPDVAMACFGALSPYEVTAGDRKLVGLAQVRRAHGTLLQAAIHLQFDAARLAAVLPARRPQFLADRLSSVAVGLTDVLGSDVTVGEVMESVNRSIADRAGIALEPDSWTASELKYASVASVPEEGSVRSGEA